MTAHNFHPTILREYDVRGIVGDTLSVNDARALGHAFGTRVRESGGETVAVGYDGRLTSPDLQAALVEGLMACGLAVQRIGVGPTPMLSFANKHLGTDGAVMVTGSHNPPDYNGFKMTLQGKPFFGEAILALAPLAASGDFATGEGSVTEHDIIDDYVSRLVEGFPASTSIRTAWDPGNGAACEVLQRLTERLGGEHIVINGELDGTFPSHHPDPTVAANLQQLQAAVAEQSCDLGIAFDGDADRIGAIDGKGRVLWADQMMMLFAEDVLQERPGSPIISDVKSSQAFFDEVDRLGGQAVMWKTGHSLIKAKLAELSAPLAGEMSGHIFFADHYYGYDDALYAGIRLLKLLDRRGIALTELYDRMPSVVNTPELRFQCSEERKFAVVDEVRDRLIAAGAEVNDIDGVRVKSNGGWWLLRASNTQDVLVARCEAQTQADLTALKQQILEQLRASGIEPPPGLVD